MASPSDSIGYFFDEHVIAAFEAGRANHEIADSDQLAFATAHNLVFVSNDTDLLSPISCRAPEGYPR
jgi:predicted nucleic acid-binding protein